MDKTIGDALYELREFLAKHCSGNTSPQNVAEAVRQLTEIVADLNAKIELGGEG